MLKTTCFCTTFALLCVSLRKQCHCRKRPNTNGLCQVAESQIRCLRNRRLGVRTPPGVFVSACELGLARRFAQARRFTQGETFWDGDSSVDILRVSGVFDFLALAGCAPALFTASRFSECCFRPNGIFDRKRSRSLVHAGRLATTPIAADPPNPSPNLSDRPFNGDGKVHPTGNGDC
jgi:hypothetical protein